MDIYVFVSRMERAFDYIESGILVAGIGLFIIITVLAAFQIFMRFIGGSLLNVGTTWTEEVARYLLVIMVFVGAPYAMRNNDNISIRPLFRLVPATVQKVLITFSNAMIVLFSLLVIYAVTEVIGRTINVDLATVTWLNVGYAHIVLGVMFVFVILFAIEETIELWLSDEAPMANDTDDSDGVDKDIAMLNRDEGE